MSKITSSILIIISIGLYYTFTSPQYDKVKELSLEAGEYRSVLDNISRVIETRDGLLGAYESIPEAELERLARVLPEDLDTVRFALDLDTLAGESGIAVKDIQVESNAPKDATLIVLPEYGNPYEKAPVSFSFISDYSNFRKFLVRLESNLRLMDIRSLSFRVGEGGLYEHKITVDTYWLKSPQDVSLDAGVGSDLLKISGELSEANLSQTLFADRSYVSLKDSAAVLPIESPGRANPFNDIGRD